MARGVQLKSGLQKIAAAHPGLVSEVRGLGLMVGFEFSSGYPAYAGVAGRVSKACLDRGMLLLTTSVFETLRFIPALNVTAADIVEALATFSAALDAVVATDEAVLKK